MRWVEGKSQEKSKNSKSIGRSIVLSVALVFVLVGGFLTANEFYDFYHPQENTSQANDAEQVTQDWAQDAKIETTASSEQTKFDEGETVGIIKVPRWGKDYSRKIVFGVSGPDLEKGTGLYPSNALPGEEGNMAIAGHRTGSFATFYDLPTIREGDEIIVETEDYVYTYKTVKRAEDTEVMDTDTWVLDKPKVSSESKHNLTLTTCAELFPNSPKRFALFAELDSKKEKA